MKFSSKEEIKEIRLKERLKLGSCSGHGLVTLYVQPATVSYGEVYVADILIFSSQGYNDQHDYRSEDRIVDIIQYDASVKNGCSTIHLRDTDEQTYAVLEAALKEQVFAHS